MKKHVLAVLFTAISAGAASAAPITFVPVGPAAGVTLAQVTGGGWTQCYSEPYGTEGTLLSDALSACTGDLLMLGGFEDVTEVGLVAWAWKVDVLTITLENEVHDANGSGWYHNGLSMGFAPQGFAILQEAADTNSAPTFDNVGDDGTQRLSWHMDFFNGDPNVMLGGWRVGNETYLNSEPSGFAKYFFTADSKDLPAPVPEPATLSLLAFGVAAAGGRAWRRLRQQ